MINRFETASPAVRADNKRDAIVFCITVPRKRIGRNPLDRGASSARFTCIFPCWCTSAHVHSIRTYVFIVYITCVYEILFNANTVVNDNGGARPPIDLNNTLCLLRPSENNNINCSFYNRRRRRGHPGQNCDYLPETVIFYYFISPVLYILLFARVGITKSAPTYTYACRRGIIIMP